jgi:predicted nucleic-acid-binding Zn-ribbon protein
MKNMEKCPKCQNEDIVTLRGIYVTNDAFNIIDGPQSTKSVCAKCGYVIEERIEPKEIQAYRKSSRG